MIEKTIQNKRIKKLEEENYELKLQIVLMKETIENSNKTNAILNQTVELLAELNKEGVDFRGN